MRVADVNRLHRNYTVGLGALVLLLIVSVVVGDAMQTREYLRGQRDGYELARADQARVEKQMADIGLCKWAKLLLDRESCKDRKP